MGTNYVTPAQRHSGLDVSVLQNRDMLYKQAQVKRSERWKAQTHDWSGIVKVTLNERNENTN